MKIFFSAALGGNKQYNPHHLAITTQLEKLGHTVISLPAEKHYPELIKSIGAADINIFEVSSPSTEIGHEIAVSLHKGKPVIALCAKGKKPRVYNGLIDEKFRMIEYRIEDLDKILTEAIKSSLEHQNIRFNFFISPQIQEYLDWIVKYRRKPRAVYLRELLERDMRENKDWNKQ